MIEFNLACYASVAGRFEEAKAWLKRAIELDKQFQKPAIDDEDLRPLWRWIADFPAPTNVVERVQPPDQSPDTCMSGYDRNELLLVCVKLSPVSSTMPSKLSPQPGAQA